MCAVLAKPPRPAAPSNSPDDALDHRDVGARGAGKEQRGDQVLADQPMIQVAARQGDPPS